MIKYTLATLFFAISVCMVTAQDTEYIVTGDGEELDMREGVKPENIPAKISIKSPDKDFSSLISMEISYVRKAAHLVDKEFDSYQDFADLDILDWIESNSEEIGKPKAGDMIMFTLQFPTESGRRDILALPITDQE